jgi:hypothetical protein
VGYVILEGDDALRLTAEVHRRMADGWRPLGGVACYYHPRRDAVWYAQAMVREPRPAASPPGGAP